MPFNDGALARLKVETTLKANQVTEVLCRWLSRSALFAAVQTVCLSQYSLDSCIAHLTDTDKTVGNQRNPYTANLRKYLDDTTRQRRKPRRSVGWPTLTT